MSRYDHKSGKSEQAENDSEPFGVRYFARKDPSVCDMALSTRSEPKCSRPLALHTGSSTKRGVSVAAAWSIHQGIRRQPMLGHESPNVPDRLRLLRVHVPLRLSEERARTTNQFMEAVIA
jgi:hypothetical protein